MNIGITERGDAGLMINEWQAKLAAGISGHPFDGVILITKQITPAFHDAALQLDTPTIIRAGCTSWGRTWLESHVPTAKQQIDAIQRLIDDGFDKSHIVLRIDPIIPTAESISRVRGVLQYANRVGLLPMRIRISILDEYPHVRERLKALGREPFYSGWFQPSQSMLHAAIRDLLQLAASFHVQFEVCAEPRLTASCFTQQGCVSNEDLKVMGLPEVRLPINGQNRSGCLCLSCKTELLSQRQQCPHRCVYCYWKGSENAL